MSRPDKPKRLSPLPEYRMDCNQIVFTCVVILARLLSIYPWDLNLVVKCCLSSLGNGVSTNYSSGVFSMTRAFINWVMLSAVTIHTTENPPSKAEKDTECISLISPLAPDFTVHCKVERDSLDQGNMGLLIVWMQWNEVRFADLLTRKLRAHLIDRQNSQ